MLKKIKVTTLLLLSVIIFCFGCFIETREKEENTDVNAETLVTENIYLQIKNTENKKIYPLYLEEEEVYLFCVPNLQGGDEAVIIMEFPEEKIEESIVLSKQKTIELCVSEIKYVFQFLINNGTSTVFLDTETENGFDYLCESKENSLPGKLMIYDKEGALQYNGAMEHIHGRGNDSWGALKSGFSIKLAREGNLLNMGYDKDYVLIPGYRDYSLLTYQIVWDLCKELQWEYALSGELVQLYVDGSYRGMYFLTEEIEAGMERINIPENATCLSGYVFEYDILDYELEDVRVETSRGNSYTFVSPKLPTIEQQEYCSRFWNEFEDALFSQDGYNYLNRHYTEYADMESLAAQWLFYELSGEISIASSVYYYIDGVGTEKEKLYAFCPWDVEHSFVSKDYVEASRMKDTAIQFVNGFWTKMSSHEEFREEIRRQWKERFLPALEILLAEDMIKNPAGVSSLAYYSAEYNRASELNEALCGESHAFDKKAQQIQQWLELRIAYLNENLWRDDFFEED